MWHPKRRSLFWLDILNRKLFEKQLESNHPSADKVWQLPEHASALAHDKHDESVLWMVTNKSFGKFSLTDCSYHPVLHLGLDDKFRANDGGVSPGGEFWFGTMEWLPSGINGSVYSISSTAVLKKHDVKIGIPNTFCWGSNDELIYISDSYQQKMFTFEVRKSVLSAMTARVHIDLSDGISTPDGGAIDCHEFLWSAHWDGNRVVQYDAFGAVHKEVSMAIPKPTSCCFGGPEQRHLFVTSAWAEMSEEEIAKHPMSGKVFVEEQNVAGRPTLPFSLDI